MPTLNIKYINDYQRKLIMAKEHSYETSFYLEIF